MRRTNTKKSNMKNPVPLRKDDEFEFMPRTPADQSEHGDFAGRVNKLDGSRRASWNPGDIFCVYALET